jgi:hypothetical protein
VVVYTFPSPNDPVDQGDVIEGCPILQIASFDLQAPASPQVACSTQRVVVLTQTCDLASQKTQRVTVAIVHEAQFLVDQGIIKPADIRGPIRSGRVYGWYYLPGHTTRDLRESIVDLRQLFTIPLDVLQVICTGGQRKARLEPLYRAHLAKHFADTFSRIGLPEPYPTQ